MRKVIKSISEYPLTGAALFMLLVAMIFSVRVHVAKAYFTTYATAKGGYTLELGDQTETDEHFANGEKIIYIESTSDSKPVWLRARAFTGEQYQDKLKYTERLDADTTVDVTSDPKNKSNWVEGSDGWLYYKNVLGPGDATGTKDEDKTPRFGLIANVSDVLVEENQDPGINVVVVYETIPVMYDAQGNEVKWEPQDWEDKVSATVVNESN